MTTVKAVRFEAYGAPDVMKVVSADLPAPASGEVQVRHTAIGFNYIDVYQRSGIYKIPLPSGLGFEAAGVVETIGDGVTDLAVGDRVAYVNAGGVGSYATIRNVPAEKVVKIPGWENNGNWWPCNVPAEKVVKIPATVTDEEAAALIFKGLTAQYLVRKTHAVQPGDLVVVHAAAGGVGQILVRWCRALGATVVGTAGGPAKVALVKEIGAHHAIDYNKPDWVETLLAETGGRKARVVYDSVGKTTFLKSLDITAPFGLVALFGAASGPVEPFDLGLLNSKGCLYVTRPSIFPHNATTAALRENSADLFEAIALGHVAVDIGARFALDNIVAAHTAAEARATTGAILIQP